MATRRTFMLAAASTLAVAISSASAQTSKSANKVVVQVSDNDPAKWNLALNNARNLQADLGRDNVEIEIVAYGPGLGMLKADSIVANRVDEAIGAGTKIVACENTMAAQKVTRDDMLPKVGYVKAGVVELMQKQQQGWAYLRP